MKVVSSVMLVTWMGTVGKKLFNVELSCKVEVWSTPETIYDQYELYDIITKAFIRSLIQYFLAK